MSDAPDGTSVPVNESSETGTAGTGVSRGVWIVTAMVVFLLIVHQDNWFWADKRLVLGFMPIGLFWHACISVAASVTWFIATRIAWPVDDQQESE
ncbi:MAG: DUF3311 domain-containing protein [Planctomycetota bacterium]